MNIFKFVPPNKTYPFKIKPSQKSNSSEFDKNSVISANLNQNLETIQKLTHSDTCSDIVYRNFIITINQQEYYAFIT